MIRATPRPAHRDEIIHTRHIWHLRAVSSRPDNNRGDELSSWLRENAEQLDQECDLTSALLPALAVQVYRVWVYPRSLPLGVYPAATFAL
jgi:hypothetical protein